MGEEIIKWTHCDEMKALALFENPKVELQYKTKNHDWRSTDGLQVLNTKNKTFRWRYRAEPLKKGK